MKTVSGVYCLFLLLRVSLSDQHSVFYNLASSFYNFTSGPNEQLVDDTNYFKDEYDFIVIGAGSGGSVVTNRLTENPKWSVLLLEAGRDETFITDVPLMAAVLYRTSYNWGFRTEKMSTACLGLKDGRCNWSRGKSVGGTSVINFMVYTRGNKLDYDEWEALGNTGWSYKDVLPYFKKSEKAITLEDFDDKYRGSNGYLSVEHSPFRSSLADTFIKSANEFGYGKTDPNGEKHLGFSPAQATIRKGRRCSAAKSYLRPIKNRNNFHLAKEARVTKILIDPTTKRATGVEFIKNQIRHKIKVKKEVILSAGALSSPHLLMLSGIGPRDHLEELGIPVLQDLKVGYNLQDHPSLSGLTFLVNDSVTISDTKVQNFGDFYNYLVNGKGPYTLPGGAEAMAFMKVNKTVDDDYPDIELVLGSGAFNGDTYANLRSLVGIPDSFFEAVYRNIIGKEAFTINPVLMRTKSRGRVKLNSTNPFHWPLLYPNYFEHEDDLKTLIEGVKLAVAVGQSKTLQKFNSTLYTVPFPGCEHLPFGTDGYWECCIRRYTLPLLHQSGTCKMGPSTDPDAVVDPQLRVHGINGLRVVDASIMPVLVAGHPNAVVFMIGEKAADIIKETWK